MATLDWMFRAQDLERSVCQECRGGDYTMPHRLDGPKHRKHCPVMQDELREWKELANLRKAIRRYGEHLDECNSVNLLQEGDDPDYTCSCGYEELCND